MPEPRRLPRVALCAAITIDGKLDTAEPLPETFFAALAFGDGDHLLASARLRAVRARLADPGVRRVFCLGGARVFRALLDAGLADDLCLLVRPRIDGRRGADTLSGPPTPKFFPRSISCRLRQMEVRGGECFLHYTVTRPRSR